VGGCRLGLAAPNHLIGRIRIAAASIPMLCSPIGYPIGRFGPVRRIPLADVVFEDRWGQPSRDL
jgi:hypothetical protein